MTEAFHAPPNERDLDDLFVFLSVDDNGMRGIVAEFLPGLGSTQFFTGSPKAAEFFKGAAKAIAERTGKRIVMYQFRRGEELWSSDATQ